MEGGVNTPVVFIVFNRPDLTAQVFQAIRKARPARLFVIADGPRPTSASDRLTVYQTRRIIRPDWPCEVHWDVAPHNMGIGPRIVSGLTNVFARVDRAIILEDDVLPDPSLFAFCEDLLTRYQDDQRVIMITGASWDMKLPDDGTSYRFLPSGWCNAWATWADRWAHYDPAMRDLPQKREALYQRVAHLPGYEPVLAGIEHTYNVAQTGDLNTWDWQMAYLTMTRGWAASAGLNLASNLGHRADGTHNNDPEHPAANLPRFALPLPLNHPEVPEAVTL